MREVPVALIEETVRELCIEANRTLPPDLCQAVDTATASETTPLAREVLADLQANVAAARRLSLPVCQDTGMAVVFISLGQEVHLTGGLLESAVNRGVSRGYTEGLLRCSVVADPLRRVNTGDNTPAILHLTMTEGDGVTVTVAPKGFGSENMSRVFMLTPAAGRQEVIDTVVGAVRDAGSHPCPPMVLGIGLGGDFEWSALMAKRALCRPISESNADPYYAAMEKEILTSVNALGIGPQGFGGRTTALAAAIETYPTHIAGLPLAVNIGCHVTRHATRRL